MVNNISECKYFHIANDKVSLSSRKESGARLFLQSLHTRLTSGNAITLPQGRTLNEIVDRVVSGYEKKQGILYRIWQCFLHMLAYFVKSVEILSSDAQMIYHYANEIKKADPAKFTLLSTGDPVAKLKATMIRTMPEHRTEIVDATPEACVQLVLREGVEDTLTLKQTAECALEIHDVYSAIKALRNIRAKKYQFGDETLSLLLKAAAACFLLDDEDAGKELIDEICKNFSTYDLPKNAECIQLMEKCSAAGKMPILISALKKSAGDLNEFYFAAAKECIKSKDRNSLVEIDAKLPVDLVQEAIDMFLEEALHDAHAYREAYAVAKNHRNWVKGFDALMKIFDQIMDSSDDYEVALAIIGDIRFFNPYVEGDLNQYQMRICHAIHRLTRFLVEKEMFEMAKLVLLLSPLGLRHQSPLKELALDVHAEAMKKKEYSLAIAAARYPLFVISDDKAKTADVKQQRESALALLQEIDKLLPNTGMERDQVNAAISFANDLLKGNSGTQTANPIVPATAAPVG